MHNDIEAGEADAGEKKNLVQLSQQRLDELIGRAFARGAKKGGAVVESVQDEGAAVPPRVASPQSGETPEPTPGECEPTGEAGTAGVGVTPGERESTGEAETVGTGCTAASIALGDTGDSVDFPKDVEAVAAVAVEAVPADDAAPAAEGDNSGRMAQLAEARDTLRLANQRLLEAMVMQQAQDAGLSVRGAAAALQMCSFDECMEGGAPSENRVKNRLQGFASSWPEFAVCAPPAPFAAGTGSGSIQQDVLKNALGVL